MVQVEPEVRENYTRIKNERGLTWLQLAQQVGVQDQHLASWMREQATKEDPADAGKPRGRRAQLPMDQA